MKLETEKSQGNLLENKLSHTEMNPRMQKHDASTATSFILFLQVKRKSKLYIMEIVLAYHGLMVRRNRSVRKQLFKPCYTSLNQY